MIDKLEYNIAELSGNHDMHIELYIRVLLCIDICAANFTLSKPAPSMIYCML